MFAGTIAQPYTWQWAEDQSETAIVGHISRNKITVLQSLADDALRIQPEPSALRCTVKILKALNISYVEADRLNQFLEIIKNRGLLVPTDDEHVSLFKEAIAINNFEMAKSVLDHIGIPNIKLIEPYELIRRGIERKNEDLICFILQNNLINSRSLLKSIFATACDQGLVNVITIMIDKLPVYRTPFETIEFNLRECIKKDNEKVVDLLLKKIPFNLQKDEKAKSNLLYYAACLQPEVLKYVMKIVDCYRNAHDFTPDAFIDLINKACRKASIFANTEHIRYFISQKATIDFYIISGLLHQREDEFVIQLLEKFPQDQYFEILMTAIRMGAEFVVVKLLTDFEKEILKQYPAGADELYLVLLEEAFRDRNAMAAYICMERVPKPLPQILVDRLIAHTLSTESEGLLMCLLENRLIPLPSYFGFLMHSIRLGFIEVSRKIINMRVNVNAKDQGGVTPLMLAAANGQVKLADLLISGGAKINDTDTTGNSPLHYAAYMGQESCAKLLITRGARINAKNKHKSTPLHLAAEESWENLVKLLIFYQADRLAQNDSGETPLHLAIDADIPSNDLIESLLICNEVFVIPDQLGRTPFSMLLQKNMTKNIKQFFFAYTGLQELSQNMTVFDCLAASHVEQIASPNNLSYALPLELALLLNNYPLAHALSRRYIPSEFAVELSKLQMRYPNTNLRMITESRFGLHPEHLVNIQSGRKEIELTLAPTPAAMEKIKNQIVESFEKINFADKDKKNYRNPSLLKNDGEPVHPSSIRDGLIDLFTRVKNRTPFLGTPPEKSPDLHEWYRKLEQLLHDLSLIVLSKKEEDEKASLLIEMGIAGLHCGGRWVGTLRELHQYETAGSGLGIQSLPELLKAELQRTRQGIMHSLIEGGNVHQYNHFMYLVGENLGLIPKNSKEKYKDALADRAETQETFLTKFYKMYHPTFIIDTIMNEINKSGRNMDKREVIIDWFKENLPHDWKSDNEMEDRVYSYMMEYLHDENGSFKVNRSAIIHMLKVIHVLR